MFHSDHCALRINGHVVIRRFAESEVRPTLRARTAGEEEVIAVRGVGVWRVSSKLHLQRVYCRYVMRKTARRHCPALQRSKAAEQEVQGRVI